MSQDLKDDLVRRGDVMDELVKEYNRRWQEGGLKLAWIEKAVDSARPVEDVRENVKGNWDKNRIAFYWKCSECGAVVSNNLGTVFYYTGNENLNYCPRCGARMEDE